jgi:hypothetical protein
MGGIDQFERSAIMIVIMKLALRRERDTDS